ncbi:MAG: DUF3667 domain-containing protein [bacterium]
MSPAEQRFLGSPCLNCGEQLTGDYCARCGQPATDIDQSFSSLVGDFFNHGLTLDSRLWQTVRHLMLKPGLLTVEYLAGRRACYFTPIRLYLMLSVVFFSAMAIPGAVRVKTGMDSGAEADSVAVGAVVAEVLTLLDRPDSLDSVAATPAAGDGDEAISISGVGDVFKFSADDLSFLEPIIPDAEVLVAISENPQEFITGVIVKIPRAMFVLVPVSALLVWLCYLRRRRSYLHHLVFALHAHAVFFLIQTVVTLAGLVQVTVTEVVGGLLSVGIPVNVFLAMRRVYGGGKFKTFIKLLFLWSVYWLLLFVVMAGIAIWQMKQI